VSDIDDLDLDGEDTEEEEQSPPPAEPTGQGTPDVAKLRRENHSLRARLRRTEIAKEYGDDVAAMIPDGIPLSEWKTQAEKLKAFRGQTPGGEEPKTDEGTEEETPPPAEPPTEEERQLATASSGTSIGTSAPSGPDMTAKDIGKLGSKDPEKAWEAIQAKYRDAPQRSMGRGDMG
jgi:hypothetical protein